jgi:hypothetical protein
VVVVAAGRDEGGRAEVRPQLEAEDVAVEAERLVDVADVQVDVAHPQALADLGRRGLAGDRRHQRVEVERRGPAGVAEVLRPLVPLAVGRELDAVAVGIGEVDRLVGAVVGGALDRCARLREPQRGAGELLARRIQQRVVVEAGMAARAICPRVLVEDDHGLAAVAEPRGGGLVCVDAQAERALVPGDRAVELGDGEVHGAEPQRGGEGGKGVDPGHVHRIGARGRWRYGRASPMHGLLLPLGRDGLARPPC